MLNTSDLHTIHFTYIWVHTGHWIPEPPSTGVDNSKRGASTSKTSGQKGFQRGPSQNASSFISPETNFVLKFASCTFASQRDNAPCLVSAPTGSEEPSVPPAQDERRASTWSIGRAAAGPPAPPAVQLQHVGRRAAFKEKAYKTIYDCCPRRDATQRPPPVCPN